MTKKAERYLMMIAKTQGCAVNLTSRFTKQADELKRLGYAIYIPISSGGVHVALTDEGINAAYDISGDKEDE